MKNILDALPLSVQSALRQEGWTEQRVMGALGRSGVGREFLSFLSKIEAEPYFGKITPPPVISRQFTELARRNGLDIGRFKRSEVFAEPRLDLMSPGRPPVLTVCLGSLEETLAFAWDWVKLSRSTGSLFEALVDHKVDFARVTTEVGGSKEHRWLADVFHPWTLAWRILDRSFYEVDANDSKKPPAGISTLFLAAQHPALVETRQFARIRGLRIGEEPLHLWGLPEVSLMVGAPEMGYEYVMGG